MTIGPKHAARFLLGGLHRRWGFDRFSLVVLLILHLPCSRLDIPVISWKQTIAVLFFLVPWNSGIANCGVSVIDVTATICSELVYLSLDGWTEIGGLEDLLSR
jgi:hypothetical protein